MRSGDGLHSFWTSAWHGRESLNSRFVRYTLEKILIGNVWRGWETQAVWIYWWLEQSQDPSWNRTPDIWRIRFMGSSSTLKYNIRFQTFCCLCLYFLLYERVRNSNKVFPAKNIQFWKKCFSRQLCTLTKRQSFTNIKNMSSNVLDWTDTQNWRKPSVPFIHMTPPPNPHLSHFITYRTLTSHYRPYTHISLQTVH
jgi:hypothetical protein